MPNLSPSAAWLENASHEQIPIQGSCSIGRSPSNQVILTNDKISRRHAMIQVQREGEYWLVDFGSRNGTYLNGKRIMHPTRLYQGDRLTTGPFEFVFRTSQPGAENLSATSMVGATIADVRTLQCWLLVADIIGSTQLLRSLSLDELPMVTGRWVAECKATIETHGGRINQFMGDGFFAYWRDYEGTPGNVGKALQVLGQMQEQGRPAFRVVVHYGAVALGGFSVGEEERISGSEVHFVFRMEKLAGKLGEIRFLSQPARERLGALVQGRDVGQHVLPGFESAVTMYGF
ncbi:MAG TPA: adenylate/guanylate cyclase domain-containing protein [Candidatus Limnocylindrales bacterium]|nr:adenylate/guanylate cyclase domain-containing protein [Candidatus Limnocylindrales bacterium]